jgi:transglutaminase-like putative cysteine protease
MLVKRTHSWKKEIAQYILLGLPTVVLVGFVLALANKYFEFLQNAWLRQTLDFAAGLVVAIFIFARRFRFITLTAALVVGAIILYKSIGNVFTGEFDAFFWSVQVRNHLVLFFIGWIAGYGLSRARFFSIFWSVGLLAAMAVVVSRVSEVKSDTIIMTFAPVLAYCFYIIYMSELIRNMNEDEPRFGLFVLKRLSGFGIIVALLLFGLLSIFRKDFDAIEKEWGGAGKSKDDNKGGNSMTKNDGQGTTNNNNMGLSGMNNKANKDTVMFVAKLDNYFPDGKTPNPLYFTTDFYSKFDTETQTFEVDSTRPMNDLFSPDVSKVPLFFTKQDTSVIRKTMSDKNMKIVTAEVYKHSLSPRTYTAPSTGFFVQPISVPDENKDIYKSAYRAKMYVSELNSAYFVYNPVNSPGLAKFQQQRFEILRKANTDYTKAPANFLSYYTFMPQGNDYDSIRQLAKQIVARSKAKTRLDEIIAMRDYFLAKDEDGQQTFKYSDNPGIPGIPSANKLTYFLFQNKKGYCAYYAGATLFLLRSLGIPSRIATGFLTVDRSSKNPGWYWFYEDQAHAWVQAWFPNYGWIDFDTTVPFEDQQQAPQPDQTPPLTSQTAWLVATGKALAVDTLQKRVTMQVDKMLYWDDPYEFTQPGQMLMDVSIAKISLDTGAVNIRDLHPGDDIVSVSYSEQFKQIPPKEEDNAVSLLKKFPNPAPIDEIKIMAKDDLVKKETTKEMKSTPVNWRNVFFTTFGLVLFVILLLLLLPWLIFQFLHAKAKGADVDAINQQRLKQLAYWRFIASAYYLNQMGYERGQLTSAQFAREVVDPRFNTNFTRFMNAFLKTKYSRQPLDNYDAKAINEHYIVFYEKVKQSLPVKYRFSHWLNFYKPVFFFEKPKVK